MLKRDYKTTDHGKKGEKLVVTQVTGFVDLYRVK